MDRQKCLSFNPFEGDFGEQGDRTFFDKIVVGRKDYICSHCKGPINKGEEHRSRVDKADGEFMSFRWCPACCTVMIGCETEATTEDDWNRMNVFEEQWEARGSQGDAQPTEERKG